MLTVVPITRSTQRRPPATWTLTETRLVERRLEPLRVGIARVGGARDRVDRRALCLERLLAEVGAAAFEIWPERRPVGSWIATTSWSRPLDTTISTWTGP